MTTPDDKKLPPKIPGLPLLGNILKVTRSAPTFLQAQALKHNLDLFRFRIINKDVFVVAHPNHVKHILIDNAQNYGKYTSSSLVYTNRIFGNGLFASDGNQWLFSRRLMQPAFHKKYLPNFANIMVQATSKLTEDWATQDAKHSINILDAMTSLTLSIAGMTLFGVDLNDQANEVSADMAVLTEAVTSNLNPLQRILPTKLGYQFDRSLTNIENLIYEIINKRRQKKEHELDLLTLLLDARDKETGRGLTDLQLRDEVLTLLFAGHETTAMGLVWTWFLLAQHPEVEAKLQYEIDSVLGARKPVFEDLPNLTYTKMVFQEAMRIYPPGWVLLRRAKETDQIGEYNIPSRARIIVLPYLTHQNPDYWPDPQVFDPERFAPETTVSDQHEFAYYPFGGGQRMCIGKDFAIMEAQLAIATIVQNYSLKLESSNKVTPLGLATLRPEEEIMMTVKKR